MNKIYRTVYSETLGTWVAVSENTAARGKRSSSKTGAAVAAAMLGAAMLMSPDRKSVV